MCMAPKASAQPSGTAAQAPARGFVDAMIMSVTKGKRRLSARFGGPGNGPAAGQSAAGVTGPSPSYTGG